MAEVPGADYTPYATAVPTERPVPLETPATPGEAFGTNIARAIQTFGGDLKESGNELWERALAMQKLRNENEAREHEITTIQSQADEQEKYLLSREKAAQDGLQPHLGRLAEIYRQGGEGLNPEAKAMYQTNAANVLNYMTRAAAAHAAQGGREYTVAGYKANIDIINNKWADYTSSQEMATKKANGEAIIRKWGALEDMGADEVESKIQDFNRKLRVTQILGVAQDFPKDAMQMAEFYKKELGSEYAEVHARVEQRYKSIEGDAIADKAIREKGDKDVGDVVDETRKKVESDPNAPPGMASHVDQLIRSKNRGVEYDVSQRRDNLEQTLLNSIAANPNARTSAELFRSDPQAAAAAAEISQKQYGARGAQFLNSIDDKLNHRFKAANEQAWEDNYNHLVGLSYSKLPRDREEFLRASSDFHEWNLDPNKIPKLIQRREQVLNHPEQENPLVQYAVKLAKTTDFDTLHLLGLDKPGASDSAAAKYHRFTGSLSIGIDEWIQRHGGERPNDQQLNDEIIKPALRNHVEGNWYTLNRHRVADFDLKLSPATIKQTKQAEADRLSKLRGQQLSEDDVSDEEAFAAASRNFWKLLYERQPSGGK